MAHSVKQLLTVFMQQQDNWKVQLLNQWPTIIGNLHNKVVIEKIEKDTIVLGVFDSCWMHELYALSPVILHTINANLDQPHIKHVRFKRAGLRKKNVASIQKSSSRSSPTIALTTAEQQALRSITDPGLQEALKAFLIRCYQEKI